MKTEFVSLVSHELRTPMTSIKGYVDLLLDADAGEITEDQREFLTIVGNNVQRLVALINDILDISRIEAGAVDLKLAPHSMAQLVTGVVTTLRPQIVSKQQRLTIDLPDDPLIVSADADRITQIITNLVSNAHKYTPAGGEITVRARREPQAVRVEVSDTGVGLAPDEQKQLFTRFYRARNRATQGVGGTGLGLSITRNLVELHGGEMTVISAPGEGSTFGFTIPTAPPLVSETKDVPVSARGGTILVVEDEPDIANLIRHYLERAGYAVITAGTAADAVDLAMAERPQLITLDILLPDSDGFDVLERLQADERTAAIPVIMLSILADGQGTWLGAVEYLTKPVDERLLLQQVHRLLADDQPRTVLVADDDEHIRALIVAGLRKAGHQVLEAINGAEAVMLCAEQRPDLALLDVRMPVTDGIEALSALRADPATRDIPVVMMTASADLSTDNRTYIEELGATLLPQKPLSAKDLAQVIDQAWARIGPRAATPAGATSPKEGQP
jgi:CheY-like chemotaxis protein/two-component sensor histidine kinase